MSSKGCFGTQLSDIWVLGPSRIQPVDAFTTHRHRGQTILGLPVWADGLLTGARRLGCTTGQLHVCRVPRPLISRRFQCNCFSGFWILALVFGAKVLKHGACWAAVKENSFAIIQNLLKGLNISYQVETRYIHRIIWSFWNSIFFGVYHLILTW